MVYIYIYIIPAARTSAWWETFIDHTKFFDIIYFPLPYILLYVTSQGFTATWRRRGFYTFQTYRRLRMPPSRRRRRCSAWRSRGKNSSRKFYFFKLPSDAMHVFHYFFSIMHSPKSKGYALGYTGRSEDVFRRRANAWKRRGNPPCISGNDGTARVKTQYGNSLNLAHIIYY